MSDKPEAQLTPAQAWSDEDFDESYKPNAGEWRVHAAAREEREPKRIYPRCQRRLGRSQQDVNAHTTLDEEKVTCPDCRE